MSLLQALILGIVEGLTEYLPVSSTGHLIIAQRMLGIEASEAANAYAIAIQGGAIVAILGMYRKRLATMAAGFRGDATGKRLSMAVVVAFIPAAVAGLLFEKLIDRYLFGPAPVVVGWVVGAIAMLVLEKRLKGGTAALESLTLRAAFVIGVAQTMALWPGMSRSLSTILGGMLVGLSLPAAVEFSFLLGVVTLGAATAYKVVGSGGAMLAAYDPAALLLGVVASWVSAMFAVRGMVAWLEQHGLALFAWWRLLAAALVGGALLLGWW